MEVFSGGRCVVRSVSSSRGAKFRFFRVLACRQGQIFVGCVGRNPIALLQCRAIPQLQSEASGQIQLRIIMKDAGTAAPRMLRGFTYRLSALLHRLDCFTALWRRTALASRILYFIYATGNVANIAGNIFEEGLEAVQVRCRC